MFVDATPLIKIAETTSISIRAQIYVDWRRSEREFQQSCLRLREGLELMQIRPHNV